METRDYEVGLKQFIKMVVSRFWMIAVIVVFTSSITAVFSLKIVDKVYEASSRLVISTKVETGNLRYDDVMLNQRLVKTYSEIIKSRSIADKVINSLGLTMSHIDFAKKVQVNSVSDTEVIEIRVRDNNPQLAARITDELSKVFIEKIVTMINIDNIQILDRAVIPDIPVSPKPVLNIIVASFLGVMLGIGVVLLMEYLDSTMKTLEDVKKYLSIPILACIPYVNTKKYSIKLVTYYEPKCHVSEIYRMLRTSINFANVDTELKTIVVTSSGNGEGKSTSVSNLAISMVRMGYRVLLVDADLRNPSIHTIFNIDNNYGLTNVLMGGKIEYMVQGISSLPIDILPSGSLAANPSEMLGSNRMKWFLEECKKDYDIVLIDSSPIGLVTDSAILSSICDGTIMVVAAGEVQIEEVIKSKELMDKVRGKILGVVLNKIRFNS